MIFILFAHVSCRVEAFNSLFGQHMRANRLDLISVDIIEETVNSRSDVQYTRAEIIYLIEVKLFLLSDALGLASIYI